MGFFALFYQYVVAFGFHPYFQIEKLIKIYNDDN